jgi:diguanylate cyclase (GGDEF)-like protein
VATAVEALERSEHQEFRDEVIAAAGRLHLDRGRLEEAIETLGRARALIPEDETSRRVSDLHEALALAHERIGDLAGALEHYKAFTRVRLAVSDSAIGVRTRGLMLQFDVERARQQEEIFRLRNVELAKANAELQELHEQLEESVRELHRISVEDALTSLHNRRFVDMRLGPEVDRARRYGHPLCAAMCDMDFFKEVNDRFSHAIGDAVLRRVAGILLEGSRSPDIVSRYGGEEFLLILPETDLEGALTLAERVRAGVEQYPWEGLAPGLRVTISIGIACLDEGGTPESLVGTADLRLYQAKRVGRNRVFAG